MAIALDAVTNPTNSTNVTSKTFSHTCTGSNLILYVACGLPTSDLITGITYNGVSMTLAQKYFTGGSRTREIYLFRLVAPSTGANNVVISASSTVDFLGATSISYTGVKQSGQPDASTTNNSTTTITTTLTTVADNSWAIIVADSINSISVGSGVTSRGSLNDPPNTIVGDSNGALTPAGSHSMTINASATIGVIMESFSPYITPATTYGSFFQNFV